MIKRTHIELFAGCGGLNLGLETAGFGLYFANEISPMAGETYAYNFLNENLANLALENKVSEKVLWVNSDFENESLKERLRENPFEGSKKYSDLLDNISLEGKLVIGNIDKLLDYLIISKRYKEIKKLNIDILSGGPPCQSFSLAGKREKNNDKNSLPLSFAKFAGLTQPKVVLLENVKGITSPFSEENQKYYAWLEVSKAFVLEGFYPVCMMINSKYFGVPQNRPRFILLAFRKDIFNKLLKRFKDTESIKIIENTNEFYKKVIENKNKLNEVTIADFKYFDIEKEPDLFNGLFLPKIETTENEFISVSDAISDLLNLEYPKSQYLKKVESIFEFNGTLNQVQNFEARTHNNITEARFRFYQILEQLPLEYKRELMNLLYKREINCSVNDLFTKIKDFKFLVPSKDKFKNKDCKLKSINDLTVLVQMLYTKKHSQRSLNKDKPAPAQLTVPDDICHYHFSAPRVLTVREMARIQSFPDWFEFRSKVTTGGKMRRFETPQYTQVGNAVPPLLGLHLGNFIKNLLDQIKE